MIYFLSNNIVRQKDSALQLISVQAAQVRNTRAREIYSLMMQAMWFGRDSATEATKERTEIQNARKTMEMDQRHKRIHTG